MQFFVLKYLLKCEISPANIYLLEFIYRFFNSISIINRCNVYDVPRNIKTVYEPDVTSCHHFIETFLPRFTPRVIYLVTQIIS